MNTRPHDLEVKEVNPDFLAIKNAQELFMKSFDEFKSANDQRLKDIESKKPDVLHEEKVDRINAALDEQKARLDALLVQKERTGLVDSKGNPLSADRIAHKAAFGNFIRKGDENGLRELEAKALSVGSDPDGGYMVTPELDTVMERVVSQVSPIRRLATVRSISSAIFRKPWNQGGATGGWVSETSSRTETVTPKLSLMEFPTFELYAMPGVTQSMLDDGMFDVESYIADEVAITFAEQEGAAFVLGDGATRPRGLMGVNFVPDASQIHGRVGYVPTGVAGAFPAQSTSSNPNDALLDLQTALKVAYLPNAAYLMNRVTRGLVRKFKDMNGEYIWQPSMQLGIPDKLNGFACEIAEDMPNVAANAFAIAFGDFKRAYLIVDRIGTRILRDPFTQKPFVLFYTTKRVGGGVQNYEAYKALRFATS